MASIQPNLPPSETSSASTEDAKGDKSDRKDNEKSLEIGFSSTVATGTLDNNAASAAFRNDPNTKKTERKIGGQKIKDITAKKPG
ncbi:MAG: hypothetical protein K1060chlam4_01460, partial [Candidatus Anoxychlamydiales bacterium]|nr:hypothetical protein [Candidatus Anoxychlamydiales bacterium]